MTQSPIIHYARESMRTNYMEHTPPFSKTKHTRDDDDDAQDARASNRDDAVVVFDDGWMTYQFMCARARLVLVVVVVGCKPVFRVQYSVQRA